MKVKFGIAAVVAITLGLTSCKQEIKETEKNEIQYVDQTLTLESAEALHRKIDVDRASQLVMWAMPMVQFTNAHSINYDNLGYERTETNIGLFNKYNAYPYFTPNMVTPYTTGSMDLSVTGPVVLNIPEGGVYGVANNIWQEPIKEINSGKAETLLFVGKGQAYPEDFDGEVIHSDTYKIWWFYRVLGTGPEADALKSKVTIYPLSKADNPPANKVVEYQWKEGDITNTPPTDMGYWEIIKNHVQTEPMKERDRFFYAWLRDLGIEKGKEFNPTPYQKEILEEGLTIGLAMSQATSFDKDFEGAQYADANWHDLLAGMDPAIDLENYSIFDEKIAYAYEATSTSTGMVSKTVGKGSAYLGSYYDADGYVLEGGKSYTLRVEPNVPAANFWSLTLYEAETRLYVVNSDKRVDFNSRDKALQYNEDGSLDLYFGPTAPEGKESNWIETKEGRSWFTYFRCYGPTERFFNETYKMNNIQKMK